MNREQPSVAPSVKPVVREMLRSWADDDLDKARTLIADDAQAWLAHAAGAEGSQANRGTSFSLARWLDLLQGVLDQIPQGLSIILHEIIEEEEWAAVAVESHGQLSDGRLYNMHYTFWFQVVDGRIEAMKQYFDTKYGEQFFLDVHFQTE